MTEKKYNMVCEGDLNTDQEKSTRYVGVNEYKPEYYTSSNDRECKTATTNIS